MLPKSIVKIRCYPNIGLLRIFYTSDEINCSHSLLLKNAKARLRLRYDAAVFTRRPAPSEDWRRGDSNPRPEMFQDKRLHA